MSVTVSYAQGFDVGDVVTMLTPLSKWERFRVWLSAPHRWPPTHINKAFAVTNISSSSGCVECRPNE